MKLEKKCSEWENPESERHIKYVFVYMDYIITFFCSSLSTILQKDRTMNNKFFFLAVSLNLRIISSLGHLDLFTQLGFLRYGENLGKYLSTQLKRIPVPRIWNAFVTSWLKYNGCAIFKEDHENQTKN